MHSIRRGSSGYISLAERGAYDAIAAVGMHDKPMSGGFAAHTFGMGRKVPE